jgi:hypothetical protein
MELAVCAWPRHRERPRGVSRDSVERLVLVRDGSTIAVPKLDERDGDTIAQEQEREAGM